MLQSSLRKSSQVLGSAFQTAVRSKTTEAASLNKTVLVNTLIEQGFRKTQAIVAVETVLESIIGTVAAGGRASFPGFGTFSSRRRAARTGLNPQTKESISIPAKTVPVFKAGKKFTDSVAKQANEQ